MALPIEFEELMKQFRASGEQELTGGLGRLAAEQTRRGTFTSGAGVRGAQEMESDWLRNLLGKRAELGLMGAEAERGERTAKEARDWQSAEAAKARAEQERLLRLQKEWQDEREEKARQENERQMLTKLVGGVALGALTGGLGGAGLFGSSFATGVGGTAGGGALMGALTGMPGITQMGMSGMGQDKMIDLLQRLNLLGSKPSFSALTPEGSGLNLFGPRRT